MKRLSFISFVLSAFLLIGFVACEPNIEEPNYVDLGLSVKWATMNVGADTPERYGDFYTYDEAVSEFGNNLPTKEQLEELKNECEWKWTTQNGVEGQKVTGPNGKSIFLPAAGYRYCNGNVGSVGTYGNYWSSTPYDSDYAWYLKFDSSGFGMYNSTRCYGLSVRLVRY